MKNFKLAKQDFEKVMELEPENKDAKNHVEICEKRIQKALCDERELAKNMMSEIGQGGVCTVVETALCDERELAKNMMSMIEQGGVSTVVGTALCDERELAKNMMSMIGQGGVCTVV